MTDIYGKAIYSRDSDIKCLRAFVDGFMEGKPGTRKISKRDTVTVKNTEDVTYKLWNTELVRYRGPGKVYVYITDNSDMDDIYYHGYYGRRREVAMTQTTKNRLNCFLSYYGLDSLEVHSSLKLFGVWHKGKALKNNTWYKVDFEGKELKEVSYGETL